MHFGMWNPDVEYRINAADCECKRESLDISILKSDLNVNNPKNHKLLEQPSIKHASSVPIKCKEEIPQIFQTPRVLAFLWGSCFWKHPSTIATRRQYKRLTHLQHSADLEAQPSVGIPSRVMGGFWPEMPCKEGLLGRLHFSPALRAWIRWKPKSNVLSMQECRVFPPFELTPSCLSEWCRDKSLIVSTWALCKHSWEKKRLAIEGDCLKWPSWYPFKNCLKWKNIILLTLVNVRWLARTIPSASV